MKKIALCAVLLISIFYMAACGSYDGWQRYDGTLGSGENERSAVFLRNDSEVSDENKVTGHITLLPTGVKDEFYIYKIDLNIQGDFAVAGPGVPTPKTGGLTVECGASYSYTNSEVYSYISHPSVNGVTQTYFSLSFSNYSTDPTTYDLESLNWKINLTMDTTFEFGYKDSSGANQTFTYTIKASEIKRGN